MAGSLRINGRELERRMRHGVADGLNLFGDRVHGRSNTLVPHDEGILMESGKVLDADADEPRPTVQVRYGMVYAARQHEELTWKHDPGRQAKYLEVPFKEEIPHLAPLVQAVATAVVRTGVREFGR